MFKFMLLIPVLLILASNCRANGSLCFVVDNYYFEFNYGKVFVEGGRRRSELYREEYLPNSCIWKLEFKSILRIELDSNNRKYISIDVEKCANKARSEFNPSGNLILAYFREYTFILTKHYHILKSYRNTSVPEWKSDYEFIAQVETHRRGLYSTDKYLINIEKDEAILIE